MMSGNDNMRDRIQGFILERFPLARKQHFDHQTPLLDGGLLDSLGILDVVGFIEDSFEITLNDDELVPENFQTISHLVAFVARKRSEKQLPTA
jgi:acyl carrier protein